MCKILFFYVNDRRLLIFLDVIGKYFTKHQGEIIESLSDRHLDLNEFKNIAVKVIDSWGNRAFCKGKRL